MAYVPAAVLYNWTGFYIGGNLGAGWSQGSLSDTAGNTFTPSSSPSFLGGGQVGYNYQFWHGAVAGVEADFDWAGNHNNTSNAAAGVTVTNNNRWLTTLTGRLGYAWDRVLVYGKGGALGWGEPSYDYQCGDGYLDYPFYQQQQFRLDVGCRRRVGFLDNWSARLEYHYIGLNSQTFTLFRRLDLRPACGRSIHQPQSRCPSGQSRYQLQVRLLTDPDSARPDGAVTAPRCADVRRWRP